MMRYRQIDIHQASRSLPHPTETDRSRIEVAVYRKGSLADLLGEGRVPDEADLDTLYTVVPFRRLSINTGHSFWVVDDAGLYTIGWVEVARHMIEEDRERVTRLVEEKLLKEMRDNLARDGRDSRPWHPFFVLQPPDNTQYRTMLIGIYFQQAPDILGPRNEVQRALFNYRSPERVQAMLDCGFLQRQSAEPLCVVKMDAMYQIIIEDAAYELNLTPIAPFVILGEGRTN